MIKFAILDADQVFRSLLENAIESQPDWRCLLSSSSVKDFQASYPKRTTIDFIFLDIELQGESGVDFIPYLATHYPETKVIVFTNDDSQKALIHTMSKGAMGYLLKNFSLTKLPELVEVAQSGGAMMSPVMVKQLIEYFNPPKRKKYELDILTTKEVQVIRLLSDGKSYDEMAVFLGISKNGIRHHIRNIYSKLNVSKRVDATRKWLMGSAVEK
jgi:DNA-binding NarL/FixJ family response regulator